MEWPSPRPQPSSANPETALITTVDRGGLVVPALWLWMARANGRGRSWARIVSTVLFGLATLQPARCLRQAAAPDSLVRRLGVSGPTLAVLTWLVGLVVVWLLWRPASSAFFRPQGFPAGRVRRSHIVADPVVQRSAAASVVSHVDLRARADAARHAPAGLPDRPGTLLVTVVTLDPM